MSNLTIYVDGSFRQPDQTPGQKIAIGVGLYFSADDARNVSKKIQLDQLTDVNHNSGLAELVAIYEGLKLAGRMYAKSVCIVTDYRNAVDRYGIVGNSRLPVPKYYPEQYKNIDEYYNDEKDITATMQFARNGEIIGAHRLAIAAVRQ